MKILIIIVAIYLFGAHLASSGPSRQCRCPDYDNLPGLVGFCGYEVIEKRASDPQSTKMCNPKFVYKCHYGPRKLTIEVKCEEDQTCIPGSPQYHTIKSPTDQDYTRNYSRFCATSEGKTFRPAVVFGCAT